MSEMDQEQILDLKCHFYENGWFKMQLPNSEPALAARAGLLGELRNLTGDDSITLESYHETAENDADHTEMQLQLAKYFREQRFGPSIVEGQLSFFQQFIGPDLQVQQEPYLRITRPQKPNDNIDFHRDTFYGSSAFELSVWVPFVDLPIESTLSVISGSNVRPDSDFPTTTEVNPNPAIVKGSDIHKLGFPYATKKIVSARLSGLKPVPVRLGEAIIFTVATIHGSSINSGDRTRWSTDVRVSNIMAPIDLSGLPDYYEPLCVSVVTERALAYKDANTQAIDE